MSEAPGRDDDRLAPGPRFELAVVDEIGLQIGSQALDDAVRAVFSETRIPLDGPTPVEISLLITGDDGIADLHGQFLDDPTETDVMSFETDERCFDLVVNHERAAREAQRRGVAIDAELVLYVVHGLLHCVGYDDLGDADRSEMRAAEIRVMSRLGLAIAPVDDTHADD